MVAELARSVSRPDLGVRLARNARKSSDSWLWTAGYPRLPLSPLMERHWTMIHAITRQESEFYKEAVSHANARGLMQLMPGTARETAGRSEEHTSELPSLIRISSAVFCLQKKTQQQATN